MRTIPVSQLLAQIVDLRRAIRAVRDPAARARIRSVENELRRALGPAVAKKPAAAALGVSMTALDKWVDRGVLPAVARRGSSRLRIAADQLLDLLEEVTELRESGVERAHIATAVRRLGWRDDPGGRRVLSEEVASLPKPNVPSWELRRHFDRTTVEERVEEAAQLSAAITAIAAAAKTRR